MPLPRGWPGRGEKGQNDSRNRQEGRSGTLLDKQWLNSAPKAESAGGWGGAAVGALYLVPKGGLGLLSRTRAEEEVLTGRVLDLGKPKVEFLQFLFP